MRTTQAPAKQRSRLRSSPLNRDMRRAKWARALTTKDTKVHEGNLRLTVFPRAPTIRSSLQTNFFLWSSKHATHANKETCARLCVAHDNIGSLRPVRSRHSQRRRH